MLWLGRFAIFWGRGVYSRSPRYAEIILDPKRASKEKLFDLSFVYKKAHRPASPDSGLDRSLLAVTVKCKDKCPQISCMQPLFLHLAEKCHFAHQVSAKTRDCTFDQHQRFLALSLCFPLFLLALLLPPLPQLIWINSWSWGSIRALEFVLVLSQQATGNKLFFKVGNRAL